MPNRRKRGKGRNESPLEFFQHLFGYVFVAGLRPMIAVVGEKSFGFVLGVVRFPVINERFAKIDQGKLFLRGDGASHLGKGIQFLVHGVLGIVAFDPAGARALNHTRPTLLQLAD